MKPITPTLLQHIAGHAHAPLTVPLADAMQREFPAYGIDTVDRAAIFIAQAAHETNGFDTLIEYGPPEYFQRYDGRADIGNTQDGDGWTYRGRGAFQVTGRANYREMGQKIGVDLETYPERAAEPALSVKIALEYWKARGLNKHADKRDFLLITLRINGGYTHIEQRAVRWMRAWLALKED